MKAADLLFKNLGGKKANEVLALFNQWTKGLYQYKAGAPVAKAFRIEGYDYEKSATTGSDVNAGFLVPEQVSSEVCRVLHEYGHILSQLTEVTLAPGSKLRVNEIVSMPVAAITRNQCEELPEISALLNETPKSLEPAFVGGLFYISNELLNNPGADFTTLFFNMMVDAVVAGQERTLLQEASTGLLQDTAVNVLADVDTTDPLSIARFVYGAIVNNPALSNAEHAMIIAPPHVVPQLATGGANPLLRCGPGGTAGFLCYNLVPHVDCSNGPWNIAMVDTRNIQYATDGALSMDINPHTNGASNGSIMKGGQYFDYAICHAAKQSRAGVVIS